MGLKETINQIDSKGLVIEIEGELRVKLQRLLLDMYKDVLEVCNKYDLTAYLHAGSALGAIRHNGFIPWDDDLDIAMTREDYRKFQDIFEKELGKDYILNAPNYSKDSITRFPKILKKGTIFEEIGAFPDEKLQSVFLDIFIIDNIPENRFHQKIKGTYCNLLEFIAGRVYMYQNNDPVLKQMLKIAGTKTYLLTQGVGFLFSFRKSSRWNDTVDKAIQYKKDSKLCGFTTSRKHYFGEIHEKSKLFPVTYVLFEDIEAPVFYHYDNYLKKLYGDYMQIPPEDKREKHFVKRIEI